MFNSFDYLTDCCVNAILILRNLLLQYVLCINWRGFQSRFFSSLPAGFEAAINEILSYSIGWFCIMIYSHANRLQIYWKKEYHLYIQGLDLACEISRNSSSHRFEIVFDVLRLLYKNSLYIYEYSWNEPKFFLKYLFPY